MRVPAWSDHSPAERPLRGRSGASLATALEDALAAGDGASGAHCVHELWMRGAEALVIDPALDRLWRQASTSIPEWLPMRHVDWLPLAYTVTARFRALRGRSNLYLVLLDARERHGERYGVYVGMSHHPPAVRFDQHKAGIRAASSVLKHGLEVLTGPTLHLQGVNRAAAARIEAELAEALRAEGLWVEGGH